MVLKTVLRVKLVYEVARGGGEVDRIGVFVIEVKWGNLYWSGKEQPSVQ